MCGIAGVAGGDLSRERPAVERMVRAIAHRGPDDDGVWAGDGAVLGNCRLQIIDLHGGHQPLSNEDGRLWITFNGEIYNYRELRAGLLARGHELSTHTDTEVVLHLFEEQGAACLPMLRGMFAFAIWDRRSRHLFAARDRFGQKPLFYSHIGPRLLFCSEIKGILAHPDVSVDPELAAVDYYLGLRFVPPPLTLFRGISKLAPGSCLTWDAGSIKVQRWWQPQFHTEEGRSEHEWIEGLRERIDDAVRVHLESDVEVGAFLSGGLDSGIVTSSMVRLTGEPVRTFAVGSDDATFDERPYARLLADHCGTRHTESLVDDEQLESIPSLVRCLDEPSDPISACFHEASRLAAQDVKVVLGGDGGDEMFAGFDRYANFEIVDHFRRVPGWLRNGLVRPVVERMRLGFGYKEVAQKARWMLDMADAEGGRRYARMTTFFRFGPAQRASLYGPALQTALDGADAEDAIVRPFNDAPADNLLDRMINADLHTRFPEHTLMLSDRLAMSHGLELRAPLLDNDLADYCFTMPADLKIRNRETKYALRKAAEGRLPEEIIRRDKQGFMFPVASWLNGDTARRIADQLSEGPLVRAGWIDRQAPRTLMAEHQARRQDHHVRIWMLLNLDAWYRIYVEPERG
ncbi:MAG: asparagine synthase (glutamine-hydrolyzing) [Gemmatimonadota bacterium]